MKFKRPCLLLLLFSILISLSVQGCVKGRVRVGNPGHSTSVIRVCEGSLFLFNACRIKIPDSAVEH